MNLIEELKNRLDKADVWERTISPKRNDYLKVQDSIDTNLYFVSKGSLRVFIMDNSEENTIRFGYQGDFILSLDSFFTEKASDFYIQALKKSEVKILSKLRFLNFIQSNEKNIALWKDILGMLILMQIEREKDLLISSPLERYNRVLKRSPKLFQEVPHKYIASYLRMTPETLSRMRKS